MKLAQNDEEYLLLQLLPKVAKDYLKKLRKNEYEEEMNKSDLPVELVQLVNALGGLKTAAGEEDNVLVQMLSNLTATYVAAKKGGVAPIVVAAAEEEAPAEESFSGPVLRAPMGGKVLEVCVNPGDKVKVGDNILVYEAMKMENDLKSDMEGTVKRVLIAEDDVMGTDQPLIEFE